MLRRSMLSAALSIACLAAPCAASAKDIVVHAGTLIDGVSATPRRDVSIRIQDGRIVAVSEGFTADAGADVIDLSHATVLPGFIDCHIHISAKLPSRTNAVEDWLTHSDV